MRTTASAPLPRAAHVYLAQARINGTNRHATKIGSTTLLRDRARSLKSPWGGVVQIIDSAHIGYGTTGETLARAIEFALHARFADARIEIARSPKNKYQHREWFALTMAQIDSFHHVVDQVRAEVLRSVGRAS